MTLSIYLSPFLLIYSSCVALLLGAALGSFLNCAAWRIVHGESFLSGRSRCPQCGHVLGAADLVPVASWLALRGRCRYCAAPVPARYVLTEGAFALLTLACLLRFDLTPLCARNLLLLCCLFCLTLTDWEAYLIPDGCLLTAALVWAAFAPILGTAWGQALRAVAAGLCFGGGLLALSLVMDKVLGRESLGGGDVKLFAVMGLYLGFVASLLALPLACLLGLACAALLRRGRGEAVPFGPAIAAAFALTLFFGEGPVNWYLGLLA